MAKKLLDLFNPRWKVVGGRVLKRGTLLTYAKYHENKGKAPKTAPTYREPEAATAISTGVGLLVVRTAAGGSLAG